MAGAHPVVRLCGRANRGSTGAYGGANRVCGNSCTHCSPKPNPPARAHPNPLPLVE